MPIGVLSSYALMGQGEKYIKILLSRLFLLSLQADSDLKRRIGSLIK